jgi:murein DD-endopeptidase MepM/ murein hydrolase activator NlpD
MNRGVPPLIVFASLVVVAPSSTSPPDFRLQLVPAIVYAVDDPGGASTTSFVFDIAVLCSTDCALTPVSARVDLSSAGSIVERQDWTAEMLAKIRRTRYRVEPDTPLASPTRAFTLPEAFDVRFYFRHPQALAIDAAAIRLTVADVKGRRAEQTLRIPIRYYQQKTSLSFPFRGKGVVGQDWITNGGHGGVWNAFAIDIRGLAPNYAAQLGDANENASDAGWGREILAPAAGTVVYARNDVPTNPHPGQRPDLNGWYLPLHDPVMAYAGNCVIIDHGNSEYGVMMHMQPRSVTVTAGERVVTGQVIGRLGNSGDAFGPHLHYHLQSGPRLFQDQSLPFRFQHVEVPLSRGRYVDAH